MLVDFQADELIREGRLVPGSRADVMKAGIGLAVKRGAPKPDISTVAAFKQTLLDAKSITYLKEGASTRHLVKVLAQLGIADALRSKTIMPVTELVSEMVAAGEAEIAIIVIPNILSVPGAELVGPLPEEIQSWITFTAAVSAQSANQSAAREVIRLMQIHRRAVDQEERDGAGVNPASLRGGLPATQSSPRSMRKRNEIASRSLSLGSPKARPEGSQ